MFYYLKLIKFFVVISLSLTSANTYANNQENTTIYKTITLKANKTKIWGALTNEKELGKWWNKGVKLEPQIGGLFYEPWGDGQLATGKVITLKAQEYIEFSWQEKYWGPNEDTICRFTLKEINGKILLEVKHSGWDTFKDNENREKLMKGFIAGWDFLLPKLKKFVEAN